jgi:hypothetical protein
MSLAELRLIGVDNVSQFSAQCPPSCLRDNSPDQSSFTLKWKNMSYFDATKSCLALTSDLDVANQ